MTAAELSGDCTTSGSNAVTCTQLAGAFFAIAGPATSTKTFTFPNASATVLTSNAAVTIAQGGTGAATKAAAFDALSPLTTAGDFLYGGTSGTGTRLAAGTGFLYANGASAPTLAKLARALSFTVGDPAGSALTVASTTTDYIATVPFACTLSAWDIAVDAGTVTWKVWRVNAGTAIPTSANSINTSGISLSTGTAVHSTTMSDFTSTAIAAGDRLGANITAVATAKMANLVLTCDQ
jgi:hypothetical protein